jgi:D-alanyl-D-alanine carboxypeptidase
MMTKTGIESKLQAALEAAFQSSDTSFPGALLHVRSPEFGPWSGAAGLGEIETGTALAPGDRFRAGSVMKPLVAVVTLQLVEEGRFSLDDPMTAVLRDSTTSRFPASDQITLRMLLNHTSGIPEWLTDEAAAEIATNPTRVRTVDEYLDVAAAQKPYFPPGKGFTYSNTDYNLLGLAVEHATGRPWREEVRERVVGGLNLKDTLLPEPGDLSIPGNYAHGYMDMGGNLVDMTGIDPSMAGAAGGHALVTTTSDLACFLEAVLAGKLFQTASTLDEMLSFVVMPQDASPGGLAVGYGLGVRKYLLPASIEMLGHAGTTGGYQCFVYNLPLQGITIAGMMNSIPSDQTRLIFPALKILLPEFSP